MRMIETVAVLERNATEALDKKQRLENVLEGGDLCLKSRKSVARWTGFLFSSVEQPTCNLLLALERRQVSQCKKIVAFKVGTFGHELLAALVVNDSRNGVG